MFRMNAYITTTFCGFLLDYSACFWFWCFFCCLGSAYGVSGCEEQPQRYRAVGSALLCQHWQWVCCLLCKEKTTACQAVALQVSAYLILVKKKKKEKYPLYRFRQFLNYIVLFSISLPKLLLLVFSSCIVLLCYVPIWWIFCVFSRFESSSHAISMSAYLREQRRELYSKSGELQGEEGDSGMTWGMENSDIESGII